MALAQLDGVRKVFDRVREADDGDGELLSRYRTGRDQDAFGSLVRRHGPMVLGVCRRVLRDAHAAEDAFQATFIVLAKKADAVRPPDRLAPWLYGVAYRTAMKARGRAFRRRQVEQDYAAEASHRAPASSDEGAELLPVIDEQLNALPEKYRTPLVLCAVQGLNKAEAAERLGLPEGTVSSRLARAREMLRDRLSRRGVVVPVVAFAALFTADSLQAAVPTTLAVSTAGVASGTVLVPVTVLTLSTEVLRSMTLLKLKALCAVAMCVSLAGGGFGVYAIQADDKKPVQQGEKPATKPVEKPAVKPGEKPGEKPAVKPDGDKLKPAPDGEKKPVPQFAGKVNSVDAKANTISLAGKNDTEKVVSIPEAKKVFIDGKAGKLADVPKGSMAAFVSTVAVKGVPSEVLELHITGPSVGGVIKQVDATSIALDSVKNPVTVAITNNTQVTISGKPAKATDLKAGDKVMLVLSADEKTALSVTGGVKPDGVKVPQFGGKISAVDATAKTITVTTGKGDNIKETVVKLTADAKIIVDGKDVKIADVPKGVFATFTLVPAKEGDPREATAITVSGPTVGGTVKAVDATSITVTNPKSGERVVKLLAGTKVTINGKDAKAADLKAGDAVQITLTVDEAGAVSVVSGKPTGDKPKPKPEKEQEDE